MVLEIEIPKTKEKEVIGVLKALGVKINANSHIPNHQTIKAIEDARAKKTKTVIDINTFLDEL